MRYGSLFSGIGGFDLGLDRAGMQCAWQCEIEPFPVRVLERHWPDVPKHGDIREVDPHGLERTDLICGGSPCQDVSVAGKRTGLAGERSGLFFEFVRIADAVSPKWLLFENVPGLLSSNKGEDFAVVLEEITGYRPAVPTDGWRNSGVCVGPKRGAAWRVLDAQYFGVAQRRRRVFIVASPGDGRRAAEVLFEPESGSGDSRPERAEGKVAPTLFASGAGTDRTASAGSEADFLVCAPFDLTNVTSKANRQRIDPGLPSPTLHSGGGAHVIQHAVAFTERTRKDGRNFEAQEELAYALTNPGSGGRTHSRQIAVGMSVRRLTPRECERLQGFPDDWTLLDDKTSDSPRYRAAGNAVCVPVAEWIGLRVVSVEEATP